MPKKILAHDIKKYQSPPMSPPYTNTLTHATGVAISVPQADDDDDDICPVCESECTCHNRGSPSSANRNHVPLRTSTFSSTSSSPPKPPQPQTLQPLKIKLTVPPNLKFRKNLSTPSASLGVRHATSQSHVSYSSSRAEVASTPATIPQQVALGTVDPPVPKRRGRPPKAVVAAREAAKAALASAHAVYGGNATRPALRKGAHVSVTKPSAVKARKQNSSATKDRTFAKTTRQKGKRALPTPSTSSLTYSSEEETQYPTFMSAASTSSLTSSSESSSLDSSHSSESSDSEHDDKSFLSGADRDKSRLKNSGDSSQKRRDHASSNRWEIKPRKQSVDPEELGMDADSEDTSGSEAGADDEDDSDDNDEEGGEDDEGAAEADIEEEGLAEVEEDRDLEMEGKLGVSFGGLPTGWSEDEEESFDADIFFANLDDSSDSCGSPAALRLNSDGFDMDADSDRSFSEDEMDALLLMDVDSSVQVRRSNGEFEVGVELDGLTLGLDGHFLLPANFGHFAAFEGAFDSNATDVDMDNAQGDSTTEDELNHVSDDGRTGVILEESDGETTEDELVDSNGLPNQKAMALFRWPAPVSTVDPLSTVNQPASPEENHNSPPASHTLRRALEAMSAQRGSPAGNSSSLGSMDELEDIDHHAETIRLYDEAGRTPGVPTMGQFMAYGKAEQDGHAVIDGKGSPIPSPFPRSRILRTKRRKSRAGASANGFDFTNGSESRRFSSVTPFVLTTPSSDEFGSQSHAQTSDDPSSTDAIDLDDVLDSSFLDSEPTPFDSDTPLNWLTPSTPTARAPIETLNRWDRIPVGTFRRTRETSMLENTPGSDTGISSLYPTISALLNNDMLGTPKMKGKKASSKKRPKSGTSSTLVVSPVLLPVRDGDRTPTGNGHPLYNPFQQNNNGHQQKSRKELRKEKAMMKRKMVGKVSHPSPRNHQHAHRHHYPNLKTRGTSSVQRFASSSHVPHLNL